MRNITLGITTYGGADLLKNCLASIKKSVFDAKYQNVEVLVVDDGSPKDEKEELNNVIADCGVPDGKLGYLSETKNLGNVARYNTLVKESSTDFIYFLDNDVIVPDRWFWSAYSFLANNKNVGVASFLAHKITRAEAEILLGKRRILADGSGGTPERATELAGYCYGFTKDNWTLIKGFDDVNFKFFLGDSDFCCRLAENGLMSYRLLYPVVFHLEHATYNRFDELDAWERANKDQINFMKKWGYTAKQKETYYLKKIRPQIINYYAHYSHHRNWDVREKQKFDDVRPHIFVAEDAKSE